MLSRIGSFHLGPILILDYGFEKFRVPLANHGPSICHYKTSTNCRCPNLLQDGKGQPVLICDHQCRFLWLAIAAPGGQPDINAFRRTNLMDLLRMLPLGFYLIGDNEYPPSEWLLPIFGGVDRLNRDNDNANYYMSQKSNSN
jgi:hypothetical protein